MGPQMRYHNRAFSIFRRLTRSDYVRVEQRTAVRVRRPARIHREACLRGLLRYV